MAHPVRRGRAGGTRTRGTPGTGATSTRPPRTSSSSRYLGLSNDCKGMILVPGTIAWRKPLERSGPKQLHAKPAPGRPAEDREPLRQGDRQRPVLRSSARGSAPIDRLCRGRSASGRRRADDPAEAGRAQSGQGLGPHQLSVFGYAPDELAVHGAQHRVRAAGRPGAPQVQQAGGLPRGPGRDGHGPHPGEAGRAVPGRADEPGSSARSTSASRSASTTSSRPRGRRSRTWARSTCTSSPRRSCRPRRRSVAIADAGYVVHASSNKDYTGVKSRGSSGG